jgi:glyoxylase-like metal-dependent hydrolase (beta-lactamase superfamily II)
MPEITDRIFSFNYHHTFCYFIQAENDVLIAFDAGWPCTYYEYARCLKETGYSIQQVKYAIASHFHMDHAGLIGEMLHNGITCLAFENQLQGIDFMEKQILRTYPDYRRIDKGKLTRLECSQSTDFFRKLGVDGQVIQTPGHSDDSVSFVSGDRVALVGDFYAEELIMEDDQVSQESWKRLKAAGAQRICPAHSLPYYIK